MKYSPTDKRAYVALCQRYNRAAASYTLKKGTFASLSLELHAAKATVPKSWRSLPFIRQCGIRA